MPPSVLAAAPRKLICVPGIAVAVPERGEIVTFDADAAAGNVRAATSSARTARRLRIFIDALSPSRLSGRWPADANAYDTAVHPQVAKPAARIRNVRALLCC